MSRRLLLFFAIRPVAVAVGLLGTPLHVTERALIAWFGIRGIGSVYYLAYAIDRGLPAADVQALSNTVLAAVAVSVALYGISVTPFQQQALVGFAAACGAQQALGFSCATGFSWATRARFSPLPSP